MTRFSVNVNKIALIRNARGENQPDLGRVALDCEAFGAQGITVHPRPDERHIRYDDIPLLKSIVRTEFNVEGNPSEQFMELVLMHRPTQVTLVPDDPGVLTSSEGWDTRKNEAFLRRITERLHKAGIRVSIFLDPDTDMVDGAQQTGADRIELYTGAYARQYGHDPQLAIADHRQAAERAQELGIGLNAGHDLNLDNLAFYAKHIPGLLEVSIGHALVCDALYYGLKNTIQMYLRQLQ